MEFQNILTDSQGSIQTITINRPNQLNALNKLTIEELSTAFTNAEADAEIRVIVITGSGEKAFVAGADGARGSARGLAAREGLELVVAEHGVERDHAVVLCTRR